MSRRVVALALIPLCTGPLRVAASPDRETGGALPPAAGAPAFEPTVDGLMRRGHLIGWNRGGLRRPGDPQRLHVETYAHLLIAERRAGAKIADEPGYLTETAYPWELAACLVETHAFTEQTSGADQYRWPRKLFEPRLRLPARARAAAGR
jgi:hypothetical protein